MEPQEQEEETEADGDSEPWQSRAGVDCRALLSLELRSQAFALRGVDSNTTNEGAR